MPAAVPETLPLSDREVADLFTPLRRRSTVALAVSGGGDSMALLHLYSRWRGLGDPVPEAVVLTVDHGLRPEAADEIALVAARCADLRLSHRILSWRGPKPASGLQQAARAARYSLMLAQMAREDIGALVLAHTRDDQAETFLDRLARGSGVYGLACMSPVSRRDGVELVRPLLDVPRKRLRADLTAAGLSWAEDRSNADPQFRRVRMRRLLPDLAAEGLTAARLGATARNLARAATALDGYVDTAIAGHVACHPAGPCRFAANLLAQLPEEIALRLVARLVRETGGASYVPRLSRLEAAVASLQAGEGRRTLGGCVLERRGPDVLLYREVGRTGLPDIRLAPGETGIWDNRFALNLSPDAAGPVRVAALGAGGLTRAGIDCPSGWPRAVFAGSPAARFEQDGAGTLLAMPGFSVPPPAGWRGQVTARRIAAFG